MLTSCCQRDLRHVSTRRGPTRRNGSDLGDLGRGRRSAAPISTACATRTNRILKAGAISHDGRRLVVYSEADGSQVIDVATGRRVGLPMKLDGAVLTNATRLTWDEDDNGVWMTTTEGLIRFAADAAAWRETACGIVHCELTPEEWNTLVSETEPPVSACA